jgi:Zn-dependent peptidase ImmA (M78 family)
MQRTNVLQQVRELLPTNRATTADEAKEIAERQAYKLLHLLGITEPSVNVAKLIDLPTIQVRVTSPLPVSGLSYWAKTHWDIAVRRNDSATRRRFTLAHEFKHIIDHPYIDVLYPTLDTDAKTAKQVEAICDHFAACLLMPALWVEREWSRGVQDTRTLAHIFRVSPAAMTIRLAALGLSGGPTLGSPAADRDVRSYFRLLPTPTTALGPCAFIRFWEELRS